MSLTQITKAIENFVNSERSELLVIKGGWGVGKSHFWNGFIKQARQKHIIKSDYYAKVSVFGQTSLDDLRISIGVSRVQTRANPKLDTVDKNLPRLLKEVGKVPVVQKYGGGSIASLMFAAVKDTLVCIDDIERTGEGLELRDILGLANQLKEDRNCKVALIVNDSQLGESQQAFELDGEKVIDREIHFEITPEESFEYIFDKSQRDYDLIKDCVFTLRIDNLRILQRIQRFLEDIHPFIDRAAKQTRDEVIRSLILLVWSRYGKGNGAPSMNFVLDYSIARSYINQQKGIKETDEEKKWATLIGGYYFRKDEISVQLANFVTAGYVADATVLRGLLDKRNKHYKAQEGDLSFRQAWQVYTRSFDDNEEEVVNALGTALRTHAAILSPNDVNGVVGLFRQLGRGGEADTLVNDYFRLRRSSADVEALALYSKSSFRDDLKDTYLIEKLNETVAEGAPDDRTIEQVIEPICMSNSYELSDLRHLDTFTEEDFYQFFRNYRGEKLYWCAKTCLGFRGLKGADGTYESIGQKAESALRRIGKESPLNGTRVMTWFELELDEN